MLRRQANTTTNSPHEQIVGISWAFPILFFIFDNKFSSMWKKWGKIFRTYWKILGLWYFHITWLARYARSLVHSARKISKEQNIHQPRVDDQTWHIYDVYAETISLMVPKTICIENLLETKCKKCSFMFIDFFQNSKHGLTKQYPCMCAFAIAIRWKQLLNGLVRALSSLPV